MLNGTDNFHGSIPADADIHFVTKIFDDVITVVKITDDKFDVYRNNTLFQSGHDIAGIVQYMSYVYHNNPKNPEAIKDKEQYRQQLERESATGQFIGLSNVEITDDQFSS